MKLNKQIFFALGFIAIAITILPFNLKADSNDVSVWDGFPVKEKPAIQRWQFAAGFDFRADEDHASPTVQADILYFLTRGIAFNMGSGFNYRTHFGGRQEVRTYFFDTGIRFQVNSNLISPFFESGYQLAHYQDSRNSDGENETRGGFFLALGLSTRLHANYFLDFRLRHFVNYSDFNTYYPSNKLPDDYGPGPENLFYIGGEVTKFARSLYNPTTIELQLRVPL